MNWTVAQRILGLLLMMFSLTMLPPVAISLWFGDQSWLIFIQSFVLTLLAGLAVWYPVRNKRKELRLRDGFLVVASFWTVLGMAGSIPLYLADTPSMSLTDAIFESMSGLTTTGATVLTGLDTLPESILYYRQQLQWFGGMGIIVLAVAVLPMLGVGGMQLYRAETPGPVKRHEADAAYYRDGQGIVVRISCVHSVVHGGLYAGGNGLVRRAVSCVFHGCDRRFFDARPLHRPFRQRRDRPGGDSLHVSCGH